MIQFTKTTFKNYPQYEETPITAEELNKIGSAIEALIAGDADTATAGLKLASVLLANGMLNPDIIDDGSITDDMLDETYIHLIQGNSIPGADSAGFSGDLYLRTYTEDETTKFALYHCVRAMSGSKQWKQLVTSDDLQTTLAGYVPNSRKIANLNLSENIGADNLARALEGSTIYFATTQSISSYTQATGILVSTTKYPIPTLLYNTDTNTFYLLYSRSVGSAPYTYGARKIEFDVDLMNERPRYDTYVLSAANWSNNAYDLTSVLTADGATANTKVDLNINSTVYAALQSAGTERLWVENNNGTFTVHADGDVPTTDINVQLTLTEVNKL